MEKPYKAKAFPVWFPALIILLSATTSLYAQDAEIVDSCTKYKQSIFEVQEGYSFLLLNAPVTNVKLDKCRSYTPLIVGGKPAEAKEFPHMARLGNRKEDNKTIWFCGGTLISNRLLLTAAHCFFSLDGAINIVRLGELDFDSDKDDADPEDFGVEKFIVHPDYKYPLLYNDIAIVKLDRAVNFNFYKHPACLPFDNGSRHETFIAPGWGHTTLAGLDSSVLRKVKLNAFGNRCLSTLDLDELPSGYNDTTQLCIGSSENKDTCNGDSGGPVLAYHNDYPCMYHVMGITSAGIGCGTPNTPSLYTRVHFYLDWIKQELAKVA